MGLSQYLNVRMLPITVNKIGNQVGTNEPNTNFAEHRKIYTQIILYKLFTRYKNIIK